MAEEPTTNVNKAVSNGLPPPKFELPLPDRPEIITANLKHLNSLCPDPRLRFLADKLVDHLHGFVNETNLTTAEWMSLIIFLTRTGQKCTDIRQEFILLSDVWGLSALVDALNNPPLGNTTESSVLGPFFTEDAAEIEQGDSIASEGKGDYMWVEGRVLNSKGEGIPDVLIETWETDGFGFYDTQYTDRSQPDCRGKLRSDKDGKFAYRAIVPVAYPIPGDGPVGELLWKLQRHNMRPNHLHMMFEKDGYNKLTTALYPEGDPLISSDVVFGVKKSLVVKLEEVKDEAEARKRGFKNGDTFKVCRYDFVLATDEEITQAKLEHSKKVGVPIDGTGRNVFRQ